MRNRSFLITISLLFLLLLSYTAKGKTILNSRIDTIRRELPKLEGKERIQAYYKLYNLYYYGGETQKERQTIADLLAEAERQGDVKMQATARTALLYYYYNTDKDDSLLAEYPKHQMFMLKHSDWKLYYDIWVLIVNHYIFTSQSNTALREVKKMYEDAQRQNYKRMLEITDLWRVYLDSHRKELGVDQGKSLGSSYYTYYYNSRATALMGLGRLSEAEDLLMKAYEATKDVKDNSQISVFYNLGQLYLKKGDYEKALNFNNQIIGRYTVQEDPSGVLMLKKQRAEIMLQSHQFEEAADLYKQVFFLSDSLNIKDVKNQLNEFNALYKVDEMERETQQVKTRQVYIVLGVIIIALVLMGMLGLYFMNRLRQKNRELALALDHSKESDRMKTAFIQHVSHEIRTPLNIITGFSQVIGNPDYHLNGEERRNIVNSIETNTREITSFVNELLIFSEVESQNNYKLEDCVNVYLFCQGLLERVEAVNNGRLEIAYESQLDDKHTVISNLKALEGILRPLLSNALKFTEKGSVKLQVRKGEDSSMLDICVTDTGIGIPEDQRDRIFEKFYKVDSFKRGLGLGLPLARSIAQKINGDLMLDDTYKEGTRFILRIPDNHT